MDIAACRIHEVAHALDMTVRNVQVYHECCRLPPPQKRGRVATYDDTPWPDCG
ncbi:MerR family transcriptional regulator [Actinomycetes bacterium M1A6_2h]